MQLKPDDLGPGSLAVDSANLVLSNWFSNAVIVWNPQTQKVLEEYYDFKTPLNAIRFQGDLIVNELGTSSVVQASADDPTQRTTLAKDLAVPAGLAADSENLWVSDRATGKGVATGSRRCSAPKTNADGKRSGSPRKA